MDGIQTLPGQSEDGSCHGTDAGECTACRMADTSSSELGTETPAPAVVKDQLLAAWSDSVAGVHAYSSCVGTVDAFSDGHRLVVADDDRRLKVWRGHVRESEHMLLEAAVAVTAFRSKGVQNERLAVATGCYITIYDSLKPSAKVTLSPDPVAAPELDLWNNALRPRSEDAPALKQKLQDLADSGIPITRRTQCLLASADSDHAAAAWLAQPLAEPLFITCMATLKIGQDDAYGASTLVIGTEPGDIVVLDSNATKPVQKYSIPGVPAHIVCLGLLMAQHTIFVATRSGCIQVLRDGVLLPRRLGLESHAVAMAVAGPQLAVPCMASTLVMFNVVTLVRTASLALPSQPQAMAVIQHSSAALVAVALRDCSVMLFSGTTCVSRHTLSSRVAGLYAGRFMTEECALVAVLMGGGLDVRFVPRRINIVGAIDAARLNEQTPLNVPKKTKLYIEFAKREREQAQSLHHSFQRDLLKLRLRTAEEYVKVMSGGQENRADGLGSQIHLTALLSGLGPHFCIRLHVQNNSPAAVRNVSVVLVSNQDLYAPTRSHFTIPVLVPGIKYMFPLDVQALQPDAAEPVHILLVKEGSSAPLISAVVQMPASEADDE